MATCYCEIKLDKTSQNTETQSQYKVATALSQYSAHLLTLLSPLLPDRSLVATNLFRSTVGTTLELLGGCISWEEVINILDNLAKENDGVGDGTDDDKDGINDDKDDKNDNDAIGAGGGGSDDSFMDNKNSNSDHKDDKDGDPTPSKWEIRRKERQDIREKKLEKGRARSRVITDKIIKVGVKLGGSLLKLLVENENENEKDTKLWEFLEKFWARYLLHLAASVSSARHKESLRGGGQFLTQVWALLFHAGLLGKTDQNPRFLSLRNLKYPDESV